MLKVFIYLNMTGTYVAARASTIFGLSKLSKPVKRGVINGLCNITAEVETTMVTAS